MDVYKRKIVLTFLCRSYLSNKVSETHNITLGPIFFEHVEMKKPNGHALDYNMWHTLKHNEELQ